MIEYATTEYTIELTEEQIEKLAELTGRDIESSEEVEWAIGVILGEL
jgi:hypothetical protein